MAIIGLTFLELEEDIEFEIDENIIYGVPYISRAGNL